MRNPLTKEAFAEWCAKQPADKSYSFTCRPCAIEQYALSLGLGIDSIWNTPFEGFWRQANITAAGQPYTFHALAQRLRAA